jgi:hypothetical protein
MKCVATKREDMGVVSGDNRECVPLFDELTRFLNGSVEHDSLSQCQISRPQVMTTIDAALCTEQVGRGDTSS